jgi:hypothetical protein
VLKTALRSLYSSCLTGVPATALSFLLSGNCREYPFRYCVCSKRRPSRKHRDHLSDHAQMWKRPQKGLTTHCSTSLLPVFVLPFVRKPHLLPMLHAAPWRSSERSLRCLCHRALMTSILPFGSGAVFCAAEAVSKRCRGFALTYLAGLCASQAAAAAAFAEVVCEHSQLVDNGVAAHAVEWLLAVDSLPCSRAGPRRRWPTSVRLPLRRRASAAG